MRRTEMLQEIRKKYLTGGFFLLYIVACMLKYVILHVCKKYCYDLAGQ